MSISIQVSNDFYHNQRLLNGKFRIEELNLSAPPRIKETNIELIEKSLKIVVDPKLNYPHRSQLDIMEHLNIYNKVVENLWNSAKSKQNIIKENKDFLSIKESNEYENIKEAQENEKEDEFPELSFNLNEK